MPVGKVARFKGFRWVLQGNGWSCAKWVVCFHGCRLDGARVPRFGLRLFTLKVNSVRQMAYICGAFTFAK